MSLVALAAKKQKEEKSEERLKALEFLFTQPAFEPEYLIVHRFSILKNFRKSFLEAKDSYLARLAEIPFSLVSRKLSRDLRAALRTSKSSELYARMLVKHEFSLLLRLAWSRKSRASELCFWIRLTDYRASFTVVRSLELRFAKSSSRLALEALLERLLHGSSEALRRLKFVSLVTDACFGRIYHYSLEYSRSSKLLLRLAHSLINCSTLPELCEAQAFLKHFLLR